MMACIRLHLCLKLGSFCKISCLKAGTNVNISLQNSDSNILNINWEIPLNLSLLFVPPTFTLQYDELRISVNTVWFLQIFTIYFCFFCE